MAILARKGYVAISPQYRFAPKDPFPAQVIDVKASVRWLREHAKEHNIDPDRIGAMGFSAKGHLSLMLGVTDAKDGLEGDVSEKAPSSRVQAVVNYFGPTDFQAKDIPESVTGILRGFLGGTPGTAGGSDGVRDWRCHLDGSGRNNSGKYLSKTAGEDLRIPCRLAY